MMQGNDSFRLVVRRGPQPNQIFELNKDIVTLGRDITNDITINDPEVSRHHMRITRGAGGYTVEDLGSTNGTFVNSLRLTGARPMRPGDMIGLGETVTLAYEMVSASGQVINSYPSEEAGAPPPVGTPPPSAPAAVPPSPYAPPVQQQAPQQPSPYAPPQAQQQPPAQQSLSGTPPPYVPSPAQQQGQPQYAQQQGQAPYYGGEGYQQSAQYGAPPQGPAGYEYDPYDARDEERSNTTRWILIGCVGMSFLCCCSTVVGAILVDQSCSWDKIPVIYDLLQAFGYRMIC